MFNNRVSVKFNLKWFLISMAIFAAAVIVKVAWAVLTWLFWPLLVVVASYVTLNMCGKVPGPFSK